MGYFFLYFLVGAFFAVPVWVIGNKTRDNSYDDFHIGLGVAILIVWPLFLGLGLLVGTAAIFVYPYWKLVEYLTDKWMTKKTT